MTDAQKQELKAFAQKALGVSVYDEEFSERANDLAEGVLSLLADQEGREEIERAMRDALCSFLSAGTEAGYAAARQRAIQALGRDVIVCQIRPVEGQG